MTIPSLPISRLINVSTILSPLAAQAQSLSTMLILGNSDVIDTTERLRTYSTIAAVAADFSTTSAEYLSALLWFSQAPQPTLLKIGRWAQTATAGRLRGGILSATQQLIATFNAVTTPAFEIDIDGNVYAIAPASFATASNLNGVASIVQTALNSASAGTTCVWNSVYSRFEIESGTTGVLSAVSFAEAPTAVGTITFSVNPSNLDTITLNGTAVTFVTGTPSGGQVKIAATLALTLANLMTFLAASVDVQIVKFTYALNNANTVLELEATTPGSGGNSLTIAASAATASGSTLAGGSGTDVSTLMGLAATSSGAYIAPGIAAESAVSAVTLFDGSYGQTWYALVIPQAVNSDHLAIAAYIEAANNKHIYGLTSQDAAILSSIATSDIAYQLKALGYKRSITQYSSSSLYAVSSLFGRAITVDYTGSNTTITLFYKQEPGVASEALSATQIGALEAKNCNVFVAYNNNTSIIEPGVTASGSYIDEITGSDWLAVTIQTALYNLLYTSTTKIPQTDTGMHLLVVTAESVLSQAVTNGLLAPGVWDVGGFGTLNQGDFMPKGFYVFAPPVASQTLADRAARKSTSIQIAAKLAGAIHTVNVAITFSR